MKHFVFRILFGLVLFSAIAGIALIAYNAGVTHSAATNIQTPAAQNGGQSYPVYVMPYWRSFPFFGFGCFFPLALLFLLFLAFGAARRMLWGPRFGWRMWHRGYAPWGDKGSDEGVPPMFAEMHRRMHAAEGEKPADQPPQK
jgi:hypothetical protein